VENKIFANVYNDLGEYATYVNRRAIKVGKSPVLILLTVKKVDATTKLGGFQPLVYEQFFEHLLRAIGPLLPGANSRHVSYLLDFVRTIQNLRRSEVPIAIREFVRDNRERLAELQRSMGLFRREMDRKLRSGTFQSTRVIYPRCTM